jgi:hypothetical protein
MTDPLSDPLYTSKEDTIESDISSPELSYPSPEPNIATTDETV